jgi:hypothetical protein
MQGGPKQTFHVPEGRRRRKLDDVESGRVERPVAAVSDRRASRSDECFRFFVPVLDRYEGRGLRPVRFRQALDLLDFEQV